MKQELIERLNQKPIVYQEQRYITFELVDQLHERPAGHTRKTFNSHQHRMTDGKHFICMTANELRKLSPSYGPRSARGGTQKAYLLAEKGYALIVKVFDDDLAWAVQEELVDGYFRLREAATAPMSGEMAGLVAAIQQTNMMLNSLVARMISVEERIASAASVRHPASPPSIDTSYFAGREAGSYMVIAERAHEFWPDSSSEERRCVLRKVKAECVKNGIWCYPIYEKLQPGGRKCVGPYAVDQSHKKVIDDIIIGLRDWTKANAQMKAMMKARKELEEKGQPRLFPEILRGAPVN